MTHIVKLHRSVLLAQSCFILHIDEHKPVGVCHVHAYYHDDVIKWKHQRPVTRSFDIFSDLRLNNGLVNNREAGDLRRHRAHYDITVMTAVGGR